MFIWHVKMLCNSFFISLYSSSLHPARAPFQLSSVIKDPFLNTIPKLSKCQCGNLKWLLTVEVTGQTRSVISPWTTQEFEKLMPNAVIFNKHLDSSIIVRPDELLEYLRCAYPSCLNEEERKTPGKRIGQRGTEQSILLQQFKKQLSWHARKHPSQVHNIVSITHLWNDFKTDDYDYDSFERRQLTVPKIHI